MMLTLHDPQRAKHYYETGVWQNDTLYTLLRRHALAQPDAIALRDPHAALTWRALFEEVERIAASLHACGLHHGDRVAIWLPSRVECVAIFLACSRNGYVCCPSLHQSYTAPEIITLLKRVRCKAFFTMPGHGAETATNPVFALLTEAPELKRTYVLGPAHGDGAPAIENAVPYPDATAQPCDLEPDLNPDKITYLAFTSGTTGLPKGVMHSDNTLLVNGRTMVSDWHHDRNTVLLSLSPMSHHIGTVAMEQFLVAGMQLVIHNPAAGKAALDWALETGATYVMGVPTHAMDILDDLRRRGGDKLGKVRTFYMAGSPIPLELAEQFLRIGITPQNVYGMTENGSHQYTLPTDPTDTIVGTCGRSGAGYEVRIFDAENPDIELPAGQTGEIGGRGGQLTLGYYDDQFATETSFNKSGWFMSGDLGILDAQNCLQIVGRKKDLIIRGGHNIHPARIEDLAHRHPGIAKAAAFAVADERLGERVCLAIIVRPGFALAAMEVLQHLHEAGLSRYDMPEYFITLAAFPLTASGKILKRDLKDMAARGEISPEPVRWSAQVKGA